MNRVKLLEKTAVKLEDITGYKFKDGIPEISDKPVNSVVTIDHNGLNILYGQYIGKNLAKYYNNITRHYNEPMIKPNSIFLNAYLKSKALKKASFHELAHALHFQNNDELNDSMNYIYSIKIMSNELTAHSKNKFYQLMEIENQDNNMILHKFARYESEIIDLFGCETEGFAEWLTEREFPSSKSIFKDVKHGGGYEIYSTLEKMYGFEKALKIAMTPKGGIGQILRIYEKLINNPVI